MCKVFVRHIYLLHPSKDDVILFWKFLDDVKMMTYDAMMMQYAKDDAIMVQTHNSVTEARG